MAEKKTYIIGTRKSVLALKQTHIVRDLLMKAHPDYEFLIEPMSTTGDNIKDVALSKIGDKALFTKELEVALEAGKVDLVVHSLKDLSTTLPPGMVLGAITEREDPSDGLVLSQRYHGKETLATLPEGSVIGTSSLRRAAQIKRKYPHLQIQDVRGNVDTRIAKLDDPEGPYAGIILAVAGLVRMGLDNRISHILTPSEVLHAVSQGALGIECRQDDKDCLSLLDALNHRNTRVCCLAERALLRKLEGGCSVPIGANTVLENGQLVLRGLVASLDGTQVVEHEETVELPTDVAEQDNAAETLGNLVAEKLLSLGADTILVELRKPPHSAVSTADNAADDERASSHSPTEEEKTQVFSNALSQLHAIAEKLKQQAPAATENTSAAPYSGGTKREYERGQDEEDDQRYSRYRDRSSRDHDYGDQRESYDRDSRHDEHNRDTRRHGLGSDDRRSATSYRSAGEVVQEEVYVPSHMVGFIIGNRGENIRRIQDQTGAKVDIQRDETGPERRATVRGEKDQVKSACDMIRQQIQEKESSRDGMGSTGSRYATGANAYGGSAGGYNGGGSGGGGFDRSSYGPSHRSRGEDSDSMQVPGDVVGLIIGRGGENIRDMEERSRAVIKISPSTEGRGGDRTINIFGSADAIATAKQLIQDKVSEGSNRPARGSGGGGGGRFRDDRYGRSSYGRQESDGHYDQAGQQQQDAYSGNYDYSQYQQYYAQYGYGDGQYPPTNASSGGDGSSYDYSQYQQYYGQQGYQDKGSQDGSKND